MSCPSPRQSSSAAGRAATDGDRPARRRAGRPRVPHRARRAHRRPARPPRPRAGWPRAYAELLSPRSFDLTTFPNDEGYDELVLARAIPVQSVCEHHMLPFVGVAHVGYLPGERILGLSKLARVVELFARRPQVQERLTKQVADWLQTELNPRGVGVVDRGRAPVHDAARRPGGRHGDDHLHPARRACARTPRSRAEFLALTTSQPTRRSGAGDDRARDVRDRRRRAGRGQGGRGAARRGLRRPDRAARRRAAPARTSGRRCPRATCRARPSGTTVFVHPADWYAEHGVELRLATRSTAVDRRRHRARHPRRRPARLRQAAAQPPGHAAPAAGAGRRPGRRALPAHPRRQRRGSRPPCARTPGW